MKHLMRLESADPGGTYRLVDKLPRPRPEDITMAERNKIAALLLPMGMEEFDSEVINEAHPECCPVCWGWGILEDGDFERECPVLCFSRKFDIDPSVKSRLLPDLAGNPTFSQKRLVLLVARDHDDYWHLGLYLMRTDRHPEEWRDMYDADRVLAVCDGTAGVRDAVSSLVPKNVRRQAELLEAVVGFLEDFETDNQLLR